MSKKKLLLFPALACLIISACFYFNNRAFTQFTLKIFQNELAGNTLNLHYTLKNPAEYGIADYPVTLGSAEPEVLEVSGVILENYTETLSHFPYRTLSKSNQLTYDILKLYLENQLSGQEYALYAEPLGPTIGTQAQLPVLLSEYTFYNKEDIDTYLALLSQIDEYYTSILHFEQAKSQNGLFMSSSAAEAVIEQCRAFVRHPEENFLITIFNEKIQNLDFLTQVEKNTYMEYNQETIQNSVIPAYYLLIKGLTNLKDTGHNQQGLCYFPDGREYYQYLLRDSTGCYDSLETIQARIETQLKNDLTQLHTLAASHSELFTEETLGSAIAFTLDNSPSTIFNTDFWYAGKPEIKAHTEQLLASFTPEEMINDLKSKITTDFPAPPKVSFAVKYVHESLESYLSPAFYLTPPLDDLTNNVIYVNQASTYSVLDLYTTLAHEGYPGHLYQTVYSGNVQTNPVRSLFNFGGYIEGWATYVEMYAYGLADMDPNLAQMYRLNRSLTLGISSLMDIAVHYHGYDRSRVASYLENFGFEAASANALYNALLEAPANYLRYYLGYLNFLDLRDAYAAQKGNDFTLKKFHQEVLTIGPAPFPILKKYLLTE